MKKFKDAFNGLKICLKHKSIVVQLILGMLAIIGGLIIKLDYYEWLIYIICIGFVIVMEIVNTAIEYLCNYIEPKYSEKIKIIKDMSAAFVLISAMVALVICILSLIRRM